MLKNDSDYTLICLDTIDSTNNYLKKLCGTSMVEEGTVILAEFQNSGKGQGKNSWHSEKGENLLASFLFKPSINPSHHFAISVFISLGISDTLSQYGIVSEIKWPNDIYAGNKKIAGILVENSIMGNTLFQTIAGIGLNINEKYFPADIPNPTSIYLESKNELPVKEVLNDLVTNLWKRYKLIKENRYQDLHDEYNARLYRKNKVSGFRVEKDTFQATIIGVGKSGELQLMTGDGTIKDYLFGEVQMII
jgi:BirA family biotin operon repressor/biotin-[acetyl-CoA-carboxylase] ligase